MSGKGISERTKAARAAAEARKSRGTRRSNNMLRITHRVCGLALPTALLLIGMGMTGAAAQGTPEARQSCAPDAMRFCSDF